MILQLSDRFMLILCQKGERTCVKITSDFADSGVEIVRFHKNNVLHHFLEIRALTIPAKGSKVTTLNGNGVAERRSLGVIAAFDIT